MVGFYQLFSDGCLYMYWLSMVYIAAGITLTVIPSNDVKVNHSVELQCELDTNPSPPVIVSFNIQSPSSTFCTLEPNNGECQNTEDPCITRYNASCPSSTRYSIQVIVPSNWNTVSVVCQSLYQKSNSVVFFVEVPVSSVTLLPTMISVIAGQQMNITCATSYCNPPANITWYLSSEDVTDQSTFTINRVDGLAETVSLLLSKIGKADNGKQVHCVASNTPDKTVTSYKSTLNILYKPEVISSTSSPYIVKEGQTATFLCRTIDANPNTGITWRWFKTDNPNTVLHNGPNYTIPNIQRGRSGSYSCTASNTVGTSERATILVDVQYKPSIEERKATVVNESNSVSLSREIFSNPLSNVSWYNGSQLLKFEIKVKTSNLIIQKAACTDTTNFTLVASNTLEWNVTSQVELIVNCKPTSEINNITLGASEDKGFAFSLTVIAYPKPHYLLLVEDGKIKNGIVHNMTVNAVNIFTIHLTKTTLEQDEYGIFVIFINNTFGTTSIYVNVIPQRVPTNPRINKVICNVRSTRIQWMSSFDGGDSQTFTVYAILAQQQASRSELVDDAGENKPHSTEILNLQPSTEYIFYVVAKNKHGSSSSEKMECKTLEETYTNYVPIVGGSLAGTMLLVILILVTVFLIRRRNACACEINFGKRKRGKTGETNEESSHYTAITEYENTERNVYDQLTKSQSEYEDLSMEERDVHNAKMYENIGSTAKQVPSEDQSNIQCATGSSTPSPERPLERATGVYINTAFMN
ncbi:nephrin-like [Crassostrea virginica]